METLAKLAVSRWKSLAALAIGLAVLVLGGAVLCSELYFRKALREQIVQRDGEILRDVSLMQTGADRASGEFTGAPGRPESYFDVVVKVSRLKRVMGVRLFDGTGECVNAFPSYITEAPLPSGDWGLLRRFQPACHFRPEEDLRGLDLRLLTKDKPAAAPVLEVTIPLGDGGALVGAAQFIMEGQTIAEAFARLDRHLWWQGLSIFAAAGGFLALVLALVLHRMQAVARRLSAANRELALAARTNAVGAVASHLIHGLKNPLATLQLLVERNRARDNQADWQHAAASTQRMQSLINEVMGILRDQRADVHYEISLTELVDMVHDRVDPLARAAGVELAVALEGVVTLSNREANLIGLILANLIQNAIEATPKSKTIRLEARPTGAGLEFTVADQGPGFPAHLRENLFQPCCSSKQGGGGIGLAICRQLATQIGAGLELKSSTSGGCVFSLSLAQAASVRPQPAQQTAAV